MLAHMRLTTCISALALGCAVLSTAALTACGSNSSAAESVRHVGLMHVGLDHVPTSLEGITDGLQKLGWKLPQDEIDRCLEKSTAASKVMKPSSCRINGEQLELEWHNLDKTSPESGGRVRAGGGRLIVAYEDTSIAAAQEATVKSRTPVVFLHPSDPVRSGFVGSLASPRANLTGVFGARDLVASHLELYTQLVPGLKRVLALVDPED